MEASFPTVREGRYKYGKRESYNEFCGEKKQELEVLVRTHGYKLINKYVCINMYTYIHIYVERETERNGGMYVYKFPFSTRGPQKQ